MKLCELVERAHRTSRSKGFWKDYDDESPQHLVTKLALISSEIYEAIEELRDGNDISMELADVYIRLFDLTGKLGYIKINKAILDKMTLNEERPYKHGKRF